MYLVLFNKVWLCKLGGVMFVVSENVMFDDVYILL